MGRPWIRAAAVSLCHLFLLLLLQVEDYLAYLRRPGTGLGASLLFLLRLPFIQAENLACCLLLGGLYLLLGRRRGGAWACFFLLLLLNLYAVLDQIAYGLFFDHLRLSLSEGDTHKVQFFWDSFKAQLNLLFYVNLLLLLPLSLFAYHVILGAPGWDATSRVRWRPLLGLAVGYGVLSTVVIHRSENYNLEHHPLLTTVRDLCRRKVAVAKVAGLDRDIYRPRFGTYAEGPQERDRLGAERDRVRGRRRPPNVVFVILESVGSVELFPGGMLSPQATPFLHGFASHAVIFDSVYSPIPATTRSHLSANTGGYVITWGGVFDELTHPYRGPSIAGALKSRGYATALFSPTDLSAHGLGALYSSIGHYDTLFDFGQAPQAFKQKNRVNGWGGAEEPVRELAFEWLDRVGQQGRDRPFFIEFLPVSTHHPYHVPQGTTAPFPGNEPRQRYLNALHYNDWVLQNFARELDRRGLLKDTIFVITGDHGESFEDRHGTNLTHQRFIYDENIESFLIILDPQMEDGPIWSRRLGSSGDILPTLTGLLGLPEADTVGQDLMSPAYQLRNVFFHNFSYPELWGLRDGQWKYIGRRSEKGFAELYDLAADPREQVNLASKFADRSETYDRLCSSWFLGINREYIKHLQDFGEDRALSESDLRVQGLKSLNFGYYSYDRVFRTADRFHPYEGIVAYTGINGYQPDKTYAFTWTTPKGKQVKQSVRMEKGTSFHVTPFEGSLPLEAGRWTVSIADGDRVVLTGSFTVDAQAELHVPLQVRLPKLLKLMVGTLTGHGERPAEEFRPAAAFRPDEHLILYARWQPRLFKYKAYCSWTAPGGQPDRHPIAFAGVDTWLACAPDVPLRPGAWKVQLSTFDGVFLGEQAFTVLPEKP